MSRLGASRHTAYLGGGPGHAVTGLSARNGEKVAEVFLLFQYPQNLTEPLMRFFAFGFHSCMIAEGNDKMNFGYAQFCFRWGGDCDFYLTPLEDPTCFFERADFPVGISS